VNPLNCFAELKPRNVYKVAIAYPVVAWLLNADSDASFSGQSHSMLGTSH
jgi:hypothetical protein